MTKGSLTVRDLLHNLDALENWVAKVRQELATKADNYVLTDSDLDRIRKGAGAPSGGVCSPSEGDRDSA